MPVSDRAKALLRDVPALWVTSPLRALAFLTAAAIILLLLASQMSPRIWLLVAHAEPRDGADDWERIPARLARAIESGSKIVLLTGGSTARELTGADMAMARDLSRTCRRPLAFVNAGSVAQSMEESWAIVNAIPAAQLETAIVATNYRSFEELPEAGHGAGLRRLPLPYPAGLAGEAPAPAAIFLHQLGWIFQHAGAYTWHRGIPWSAETRNARDDCGPNSDCSADALPFAEKNAIRRQYVAERLSYFVRLSPPSAQLWARFAREQTARNVKIVFLAAPESRALAPARPLFEPGMAQSLQILREAGAVTVDWRSNHGLPEEQFYDQQHLTTEGRQNLRPRLLELLRREIPDCGGG